ncbi:DUF3604 domain-containing protein [Gammaproteobacteria bacterium]|jgi:hypothetical protein|nr:DUF3604 domain-containing protein [Gammaproteobacteria bacterium]
MRQSITIFAVALALAACGESGQEPQIADAVPAAVEPAAAVSTGTVEANTLNNLYWGDTHLHTSYSPDAYLMQNRSADPDTAYRYAKGYPVVHPYHKARIQIGTPLDFLVVSDHAEFMGVVPMVLQGDPRVSDTETGKRYLQMANEGREIEVFGELIAQVNKIVPADPNLNNPAINSSVWGEIMDAADRHDEPGKFTAFMGWEWSSTPQGQNLHRVLIMKGDRSNGETFIPFTSLDSDKPEDLWNWLEKTSMESGADFLAIPHNSNISGGLMFPLVDSFGEGVDKAYATQRMRWEPVVEMTQIKGDSETHPRLSPNDEFADFETYEHLIAAEGVEARSMFSDGFLGELSEADRAIIESQEKRIVENGDYVRTALLRGLVLDSRDRGNPYKFGMIGSTDSHTGMASAEEDNFHGKMAIDSTPGTKKEDIIPGTPGWDMGAAGLAAVWAPENTRDALFDAIKRKEVYATTGPRIQLRFFGGFDYQPADAAAKSIAQSGYAKGVAMGGDLSAAPAGKAPSFLIRAVKDPVGANLDRIQVIKGWLDDEGMPQERIYNIAMSDGRVVGADGTVPPVGNTVDIRTGNYTNDIGDPELAVVWSDPDFDANKASLYYVRVLQIPTPRHTLYDAIALNMPVEETGHPATIQERAYSSPIWYTP